MPSSDILDRPVRQIYFERVVRENIFPLLRNIHWREIEKILWNLVGLDQKKEFSYEVFLFVIVHHILANIYYEFLDFRLRNTLPLPNHMSCTLGHGQN